MMSNTTHTRILRPDLDQLKSMVDGKYIKDVVQAITITIDKAEKYDSEQQKLNRALMNDTDGGK